MWLHSFTIRLYLSEGEDPFLSPDHATIHHNKIIVHFTIAWEASLQGQSRHKRMKI